MTDVESLLNRMSSKFNTDTDTAEGGSLLNSDLAEDKTVKWRNLVNNQFAVKDKKKSNNLANNNSNKSLATVTTAAVTSTITNSISGAVIMTTRISSSKKEKNHLNLHHEHISKDSMETDKLKKSTKASKNTTTLEQNDRAVEEGFRALLADEDLISDQQEKNYVFNEEAQPVLENDNSSINLDVNNIEEIAAAGNGKTENERISKSTMLLNKENIQGQSADVDVGSVKRKSSNNKTNENNVITAPQSTSKITATSQIALSSPKKSKTAKETNFPSDILVFNIENEKINSNDDQDKQKETEPPQGNITFTEIITISYNTEPIVTTTTSEKIYPTEKEEEAAASSTAANAEPQHLLPLVVNVLDVKAVDITSPKIGDVIPLPKETQHIPTTIDITSSPNSSNNLIILADSLDYDQPQKQQYQLKQQQQQHQQQQSIKELTSTDKTKSRSTSVSPLRTLRRSRHSSQNINEVETQSTSVVEKPSETIVDEKLEVNNGSDKASKIESDFAEIEQDDTKEISANTSIKRGRGRAKKLISPSSKDSSSPISQNKNEKSNDSNSVATKSNAEQKLGRKRKEDSIEIIKTNEADEVKDSKTEEKPMRRSVRLGQRLDGFKILEEEIKDEPPIVTPQISSENEQPSSSSLDSENSTNKMTIIKDDKTPQKKRGRKAKLQTKQSTETAGENNNDQVVASSIKLEKKSSTINSNNSTFVIPKRSQRRIKPTPKILENEELRYEYETKNIVRMTAQNIEHATVSSKSNTNEQQYETPPHQIVTSTDKTPNNSTKQKTEKSESSNESPNHLHPSGSSAIKKKLFAKQQKESISAKELARLAQKPCPDFEKFQNDIKALKTNHTKSPEDKKLSKRQLRKLNKQKDKFLHRLGLSRKISDENSDGDGSSDNEEFVPPKGVQVGKPSVTLRQRTTKETTPQPIAAALSTPRSTTPVPKSPPPVPVKAIRKVQQRQRSSSTKKSIPAEEISSEQLQRLNASVSRVSDTTKTSTMPSPSGTPKPQVKKKRFICLCHKPSNYYIRNSPENSFCCAIDNIEDQKVGCCNQLIGDVLNLLRPSARIGYMMLCEDHKKRLHSHNCCAGCGMFCTQGKFILCKDQHFFHADCAQKFILNSPYDPQQPTGSYSSPTLVLKCPHCGVDTPERASTVTMKCQTLPVFLPSQTSNITSAVQTVSGGQMPTGTPVNSASNGSKTTKSKSSSIATTSPAATAAASRNSTEPIKFEQLMPESVMNVVIGQKRRNTEVIFTTNELHFAIRNDDLERVAEILAADNMQMIKRECLNGNCLHLVAHSGTVQMAYLLLCNAYTQEFINILDNELRTPSMCAIIGDRCDILNLFIHCGADLTTKGPDGKTCLHFAAKLGNLEATQLLVDNFKATKNISSFLKFINAQDEGGWTPMVWAAELGHTEIVSYLLNHEADPDICDNDNNTVLHWATLHNDSLETIKVLLQAGADCNVQNVDGDTPLHIACRHSLTRLCIALIANGADLMLKNNANELPYDCIPNEDSECAKTVGFNMQMRSLGPMGLRSRVVCADISNGREFCPIKAVRNENSMQQSISADESDDLMLPDFRYITQSIILQNNVQIDNRISQMRICSCLDGCSTDQCQCNGASVQNWYTSEGRLIGEFNYEDPPDIFECNDVCGCNKVSCKNRIVQNGIRIPLQVAECDEPLKGWGVRSLVNIPKGSFISIYTGEILTEMEATRRTDDSYFYDLGHQHFIDGNFYGNISRFYNHSCDPNIVPVRVFYEHQDFRFPKIAFFTCRDVEVGEELCYDYGDRFWSSKIYSCKCSTENCRYNLNSRDENSPSSNSGTSTSGATAGSVGSNGASMSSIMSNNVPHLQQLHESILNMENIRNGLQISFNDIHD